MFQLIHKIKDAKINLKIQYIRRIKFQIKNYNKMHKNSHNIQLTLNIMRIKFMEINQIKIIKKKRI